MLRMGSGSLVSASLKLGPLMVGAVMLGSVVGLLVSGCGPKASAQSPSQTSDAPPAPSDNVTPAVKLETAAAPRSSRMGPDAVQISVTNPVQVPRERETVVVDASAIDRLFPYFDLDKVSVVDATGVPVLSQLLDLDAKDGPEQILFQTELGPAETKVFRLRQGAREQPKHDEYRVYGRFVRERLDDFAWENDRGAYRVYGPAAETSPTEGAMSSGVDVWSKRVERLLINDWYKTGGFDEDRGEGADYYAVGASRGCGGLGGWTPGKLLTSKHFTTSRVLANGPLRLVFELDYAPWSAGASRVTETKRVTLDAGSAFNRFESRFKGGKFTPALGIAKHAGSSVQVDPSGRWLRSWEPLQGGAGGHLGCAVVLPQGQGAPQPTESDHLLVTQLPADGILTYHVGTEWDRGGRVLDEPSWAKTVEALQLRLQNPAQVRLEVLPTARTWALLGADLLATNGAHVDAGGAVRINAAVLVALARVAAASKDPNYVEYLTRIGSAAIQADGSVIGSGSPDLSAFAVGRALLTQRRVLPGSTDEQRTMPALSGLRARIATLPRTKDGVVGRGAPAASQVWLEDASTLFPFMAEYATVFGEPPLFDDIARQVIAVDRRLRDPGTGLLVLASDGLKQQQWANAQTGDAVVIWTRALGAYASALVDVLELMPANHPQRAGINAAFGRLVTSVVKARDADSGLWWQVTDAPKREGNYLESGGSSYLIHAIAKGTRIGALDPAKYRSVIDRGFRNIVDTLTQLDEQGRLLVTHGSAEVDLNSVTAPHAAYASFTLAGRTNEPSAVAAFTLAATEVLAQPR